MGWALSTAAAIMVATPSLAATQLYTLSVSDPSAGLGAGPYGTVSVTEDSGSLIFTQTLNSGYKIHDTTAANHQAFTFNLSGHPAVTISDLTSGFSALVSNPSSPPFGSYGYGITCTTACGPGWNGGYAGTLSFKVTANSGTLSLASLVYNTKFGQNVYFTSDLVSSGGRTGNAGAVFTSTGAVPEPASWAMFIGGFGLIGSALRRRRRDVEAVA